MTSEPLSSRRDLLKALRPAPQAPGAPSDAERSEQPAAENRRGASLEVIPGHASQPPFSTGGTVRVATRAMACEFAVILNAGHPEQLQFAADALPVIHEIEGWLSVYRDHSEISLVNQQAAIQPVPVRHEFMSLLLAARDLHQKTDGAFDMASGSLIRLWRDARRQQTVPSEEQVVEVLQNSGSQHIQTDDATSTVRFLRPGVSLDPGAIGKGYALDQLDRWLGQQDAGPRDYLLHGGHSSLFGRGRHHQLEGWPVGIGNPLFTQERLGTVLVCNQAMSTSGSNIQFYRHEGRRYGHILDPRTGWPVEGMLSVTVLAPTAAVADALSTAFFVLGIEKAWQCCENLENVGVILIPFPEHGRRVQPYVRGIPDHQIRWNVDQVLPAACQLKSFS